MTQEPFLTTARMTLRRVRVEDVERLYALDGDPKVRRFLSRERTSYHVIVGDILPTILKRYEAFPGFGRWIAEDRVTGEFLGWFELAVTTPEERSCPELGYRLRQIAWGTGLATEGSMGLIDLAFRDLSVDTVRAQTMAVNERSRRVLEKCGLRHVRTFHVEFDDPLPGTELGEVEYRITREEWTSRQCETTVTDDAAGQGNE